MSKLNQNRLIFFLLGAFVGQWLIGSVLGLLRMGKKG